MTSRLGPAGPASGSWKGNSHNAGRVQRRIASPAGHGFMSAQRREDRSERERCAAGAGAMVPWALAGCAGARGRTAPPRNGVRLATNSLPSDRRQSQHRPGPGPDFGFDRRDWIVGMEIRYAREPFGSRRHAASPTPESRRLSSPPNSPPTRFRPALPGFPAGIRRRAERYDGKRDMHLLHAA
jgi:hypothetical protein